MTGRTKTVGIAANLVAVAALTTVATMAQQVNTGCVECDTCAGDEAREKQLCQESFGNDYGGCAHADRVGGKVTVSLEWAVQQCIANFDEEIGLEFSRVEGQRADRSRRE